MIIPETARAERGKKGKNKKKNRMFAKPKRKKVDQPNPKPRTPRVRDRCPHKREDPNVGLISVL